MTLHRLVLVENEPDLSPQSVAHFLTPELGFDCRRKAWKSVAPPALASLEAELVVFAEPADQQLAMNLSCQWRMRTQITPDYPRHNCMFIWRGSTAKCNKPTKSRLSWTHF